MTGDKVFTKRDIVEIDQALCNGCGRCLPGCHEGALIIVNGRAQLVQERFCDGLGACLGDCPAGALKIVSRIATPYEKAACPTEEATDGGGLMSCKDLSDRQPCQPPLSHGLTSWPIQLRLVSPNAPFLAVPELLLAADCTAFAYPFFRSTFLTQGPLLIGCPKLDEIDSYVEKMASLLKNNPGLQKIVVVMMTVPCCSGLEWLVEEAVARAKRPDVIITPYRISPAGIISESGSKG